MKVNTKIRYGLRMLVALAESGEVVNTAELGKKMLVSPKYLRKLAGPMEKSVLIKSVQGIYGGYKLNKKPVDITIASLFEAFNENLNLTKCLDTEDCPLNDTCLTRSVWLHLERVIQNEFYQITLQDILDGKYKVDQ